MDIMMPATVRYCDVDGRRIFLDLERDLYFQLPPPLERSFDALLAGEPVDVSGLIRQGVMVDAAGGRKPRKAHAPEIRRSAFEEYSPRRASLGDALTIWGLLRAARRDLRVPKLAGTLLKVEAVPSGRFNDPNLRDDLAGAYLAARPLIPIPRNCLLDSLAMLRFLQPSGIRPTLVIGVALMPFAAHAWLQDGGVILNDSLAAARRFTPIMAL